MVSARRWRGRGSRLTAGVLLAGLLVTAALTVSAQLLYDHNENRLLGLRVRELALVLAASITSIQTPLASAATLADATNGNAAKFRVLLSGEVGPGRRFVSASLWPIGTGRAAPSVVLGVAPDLAAQHARAAAVFAKPNPRPQLRVLGILGAAHPRIGYAFSVPGARHGFAVYAESLLPADRRSRLSANSAFSDLYYILFLGHSTRPADLLVTNLTRFPVAGRQASTIVPFGDSAFTLIVSPAGSLGGTFFELLPWLIALVGTALSLAAALLTDRLQRRRRRAEELAINLDRVAEENRRLYAEQRDIAQTLQHALLPESLPEVADLEASFRYVPGTSGIDVGGDWYDLVEQGDRHVLVVVGDVSGRGVRAATTMASLRHAIEAYASQGDGPGMILTKLSDQLHNQLHEYFATVLCGRIDVAAHQLTLASAGHLPPLLIADGRADYVPLKVGIPIGAGEPAGYEEVTVSVPSGATVLAFTDGLVERRGEVLDEGLARLRALAGTRELPLEDLLSTLVAELAHDGDDTAVIAVRWQR